MEQTTSEPGDQQIDSELSAIAQEFSEQPRAAPAQSGAQAAAAMDWRMASAGLVLIVDRVVAPNWNLEAEEKDALSAGFEQVLSAFFPTTNLDPRVQALLTVGGVMLAITARRTDLSTGKVMPLRKPAEPPAANDASFEAAPA